MMMDHYKGSELFAKKVLDYQKQALDHQRMILTPFLNPHEQSIVHKLIGNSELKVHCSGGFLGAEYQRMIMCLDFYKIADEDFHIVLVEVVYNQQFGKLRHKDLLGGLMSLGIKRDCIGDIYDQDRLVFACTEPIFDYIVSHLEQIKKSKVRFRIIQEAITIEHEYISETFFVSSFRLDKVIATLFKIPRKEASDAIRSGFVKVNHKAIEEVHYLCHNDDMISFRRHGRVKFVDEQRQSKHGNYVVSGYFYK